MAGLPVAEACQPQDPKNRLTDLYHRQKLFFLLLPLPRHAERCRALKETHSWPSLLLFLSVSFPHPSLISGASCSPWFSRLEHQSISQTHARFPSLTHSLTHTLSLSRSPKGPREVVCLVSSGTQGSKGLVWSSLCSIAPQLLSVSSGLSFLSEGRYSSPFARRAQ